ncbi:MAG: TatD family hydrolase [Gemmatimonadetes bacterium]|nr:TatD family hydrolase [Gemmatimonadota bacterium]
MLVDAHCHLFDRQFDADRQEVMERASAAGVGHLVVIGESKAAAEAAFAYRAARPGPPNISVVAGLHPHDAKEWNGEYEGWLRALCAAAPLRRCAALGEIGLDYHYDHSPRDVQRRVFETQLALAQELGLPVVIHAREADDDLLAALRNFPRVRAVLHSFSSGMALLEGALALGHWASFSGMVTFKNWKLDEAIRLVPAGRLMVETDAPYLAPIPHRGQRNEPAFVVKVAERVAAVRGTTFELVAAETTAACREFFGFA